MSGRVGVRGGFFFLKRLEGVGRWMNADLNYTQTSILAQNKIYRKRTRGQCPYEKYKKCHHRGRWLVRDDFTVLLGQKKGYK